MCGFQGNSFTGLVSIMNLLFVSKGMSLSMYAYLCVGFFFSGPSEFLQPNELQIVVMGERMFLPGDHFGVSSKNKK